MGSDQKFPHLEEIIDKTYTLRKGIGKGGFALVYLADVDLNKFDYSLVTAFREKKDRSTFDRPQSRKEQWEAIKLRAEQIRKDEALKEKASTVVKKHPGFYPSSGKCALKIQNLPPSVRQDSEQEYIERFRAEWMNLMGINHKNVITVYGGGDIVLDKVPTQYYSMELLEDIIEPWEIDLKSVPDILKIGRAAASGIRAMHNYKLIHRDIKPDNILITKDDEVRVTDAGLALDEFRDERMTMSQTVFGTLGYMSPEQAKSSKNVDTGSDIYSLGATLYEYFTGKRPYSDIELSSKMELVGILQRLADYSNKVNIDLYSARRNNRLPADVVLPTDMQRLNSKVPEEVKEVIQKMMSPSLNSRYKSMDEVITDFDALIKGKPTSLQRQKEEIKATMREKAEQRVQEEQQKKKKKWLGIGLGLGGLLLSGLAAGYFLVQDEPEPVKEPVVEEPVVEEQEQNNSKILENKIKELSNEIIDSWEQDNEYDGSQVQEFSKTLDELPIYRQKVYDSVATKVKNIKELNKDFNDFEKEYTNFDMEKLEDLTEARALDMLDNKREKLREKALEFKIRGVKKASEIAAELAEYDNNIDKRRILVKEFDAFKKSVGEQLATIEDYLGQEQVEREKLAEYVQELNNINMDEFKDFSISSLEKKIQNKKDEIKEIMNKKPEHSPEYISFKKEVVDDLKQDLDILMQDFDYNLKKDVWPIGRGLSDAEKRVKQEVSNEKEQKELVNILNKYRDQLKDFMELKEEYDYFKSEVEDISEDVQRYKKKEPSEKTIKYKIEEVDELFNKLKGYENREMVELTNSLKQSKKGLEEFLVPENFWHFDTDKNCKYFIENWYTPENKDKENNGWEKVGPKHYKCDGWEIKDGVLVGESEKSMIYCKKPLIENNISLTSPSQHNISFLFFAVSEKDIGYKIIISNKNKNARNQILKGHYEELQANTKFKLDKNKVNSFDFSYLDNKACLKINGEKVFNYPLKKLPGNKMGLSIWGNVRLVYDNLKIE